MKTNRAVVFQGTGKVSVETIPYPELGITVKGQKRSCPHGAIIRCIASNICGSDLHMYRGKSGISSGFVFGHEMTGEVVEVGRDVEFIKVGDIVSVPFNVACGRCMNCKAERTDICMNVNPEHPGGAYGYVDMGGWPGGQAEYVMTPYADFNLLKFPCSKERAMEKMLDLALLSDILPTGYHGAVTAKVSTGSTVYIAGAGPVGICCARSCFMLGASVVIVGDIYKDRLALAQSMGCKTIDLTTLTSDLTLMAQIEKILGTPFVDASIDCVGFEASGCGHISSKKEVPEQALTNVMETVKFGGNIGIPGVYLPKPSYPPTKMEKYGDLTLDFGTGWNKGITITTGQCPVSRYNRMLMNQILADRLEVAKYLNIAVIPLDEAPKAYEEFSNGVAKKFIIDPHGLLSHKGKPFYDNLINFMTSDVIVGMELVKKDAIKAWRDFIGPTNSLNAKNQAPYSIRAKFGTDGTKNAVHGSDSSSSASREINLIFNKTKSQPQLNNCSCLVIKPHAIKDAGKIIDIVLSEGFEISCMEMFYLDKTTAEEFFEVYKGVLPEYAAIIEHVTSGPVIVIEVRQDNVVQSLRALVGPHDPDIARTLRPNTLRAMFGVDRVKNGVHCTDLPEDGVLEVQYFFELLQG